MGPPHLRVFGNRTGNEGGRAELRHARLHATFLDKRREPPTSLTGRQRISQKITPQKARCPKKTASYLSGLILWCREKWRSVVDCVIKRPLLYSLIVENFCWLVSVANPSCFFCSWCPSTFCSFVCSFHSVLWRGSIFTGSCHTIRIGFQLLMHKCSSLHTPIAPRRLQ